MSHPAQDYLAATSYTRSNLDSHTLDHSARPEVFKSYPRAPFTPLPRVSAPPRTLLSRVLNGAQAPFSRGIGTLSALLAMTQSITARTRSGNFTFRSVPSAGALYPCELYLATSGVSSLSDGMYHFDPGRHGLTCLRMGRVLPGDGPCLALFVTALFQRSAWKYGTRAYRYCLLDAGHLVENAVLTMASFGLDPHVMYEFDDTALNELLAVDPELEGCLCVILAGETDPGRFGLPPATAPGLPEASRCAGDRSAAPSVLEAHRSMASGSTTLDDSDRIEKSPPALVELPPADEPGVSFAEATAVRRSRRNFIEASMTSGQGGYIAHFLCQRETSSPGPLTCSDLALKAVEGLEPGIWRLHADPSGLSRRSGRNSATPLAHACLDQMWLANAAMQVVFSVPLRRMEAACGPRILRRAGIEAGRLGQRLYLGATALGLGACGVGAFYDAEVARILGLGDDESPLYLVALGPVSK